MPSQNQRTRGESSEHPSNLEFEKKNVMCTVMVTSLYGVALSYNVAFSNLKKRKNLQKRRPLNKIDVPVYGKAIEQVPEYICVE